MNGVERIATTFSSIQPRAALMPYFTLGYPDSLSSLEIVLAIADSGADLIELGIPFSDPIADGPTIQASTQIALDRGITVAGCLELTAQLRSRGVDQPLLLMGYVNPILAYGFERFVVEASAAGADGFIIPDLPPEEAGFFEGACIDQGCSLIPMLSPTSTEARITNAVTRARGFIYLVSLTGTTGARASLPTEVETFVNRVRAHTSLPLAVGFGISTPQQVQSIARFADGVIVGSALIEVVKNSAASKAPVEAAKFIRNLRQALEETIDEKSSGV